MTAGYRTSATPSYIIRTSGGTHTTTPKQSLRHQKEKCICIVSDLQFQCKVLVSCQDDILSLWFAVLQIKLNKNSTSHTCQHVHTQRH